MSEPVPAGAAAMLLCFILVLMALWGSTGGPPDLVGMGLLLLLVELVVQPCAVLVHELGHAAAAAALAKRSSQVVVGRGPWLTFTIGRAKVSFSPLPMRGVLSRGVCRYDPAELSWRTVGWIALAGPIATAGQLLLVLATAPALWADGKWAKNLIVMTSAVLVMSLITNLRRSPAAPGPDAARVAAHDGATARLAFARHRAKAPLLRHAPSAAIGKTQRTLPPHWAPADPEKRQVFEAELRRTLDGVPPGEAPDERRRLEAQLRVALAPPEELQLQLAQLARARDRERAKTSVPPPAPRAEH